MFIVIFESAVINGNETIICRNAVNNQVVYVGALDGALDWYKENASKYREAVNKAAAAKEVTHE